MYTWVLAYNSKALAGHTPSEARSTDPIGAPRMLLIESYHYIKVIQ